MSLKIGRRGVGKSAKKALMLRGRALPSPTQQPTCVFRMYAWQVASTRPSVPALSASILAHRRKQRHVLKTSISEHSLPHDRFNASRAFHPYSVPLPSSPGRGGAGGHISRPSASRFVYTQGDPSFARDPLPSAAILHTGGWGTNHTEPKRHRARRVRADLAQENDRERLHRKVKPSCARLKCYCIARHKCRRRG